MKESTLLKNNAFKDLQTIYDSMFGNGNVGEALFSDAYHRIYETYGLDGLELKLVAFLAQCIGHETTASLVNLVVGEKGIFVPEIARDLRDRGFLKLNYDRWPQPMISLSRKAVEAFSEYKRLTICSNVDIICFIRESPALMIMQDEWIGRVKLAMDVQGNEQFFAAWNDLHLDNLNSNEQKALCFLLKKFCEGFLEPFKLGAGSEEESEGTTSGSGVVTKTINLNECFDNLVKKGLAVSNNDGVKISPKVAEAFLHGQDEIVNYNEISKLVQVVTANDIETKDLFFSPESQEEIGHLHYMLSKEGFEHACSILRKKKRNSAILSLLWGGPGTGKTETVKQIARETGRDIFLFDVAKVTASDWGATENLYRRLFEVYRYIAAVKTQTPILLLNEADQVLSKRLPELDSSIDKAENTVSNILLQEFEDLHGILLATTNNVAMLDEAFDRRFLFKTELQKPDARARKSIWKSMIPELSDEEAEFLADQYVMSGAQISNVATKRDLAELYFHGDRGLSYIEMLCRKELGLEKQNPKNRHIGF